MKLSYPIYITLFFLIQLSFVATAKSKLDSLQLELKKEMHDTSRVRTLNRIAKEYKKINIDSSVYYGQKALALAELIDFRLGQHLGKYVLSDVYKYHGKYKEAQQLNFELLEMATIDKDTTRMSWYLGNIGAVEYFLGNYASAVEHVKKSISFSKRDKYLSDAYLNLAAMFAQQGELDSCIYYYKVSEKLYTEFNRTEMLPHVYLGIGALYEKKRDYDSSLVYLERASKMYRDDKNIEDLAYVKHNKASVYLAMNDYQNSERLFLEALNIGDSLNDIQMKLESFMGLKSLYHHKHDYKIALSYADSVSAYEIKVRNKETQNAIVEMETKYETEKKEQENELLKNKNKLQEAEIDRKNVVQYAMIGGIGLLFVISGLIFVQFRNKKKANEALSQKNFEIESQNEEIMSQRDLLEQQNQVLFEQKKSITESINYAERIQRALLNVREEMVKLFPPFFIFFQPKDIVSGDFYWATEKKGYIYATAADCTGHGVPGAFMSMLGISFLNEIIKSKDAIEPSEILNRLKARIIKELGQGEGKSSKDGMDMALIRYHKETGEVLFAGANNPLYLVTTDESKKEIGDRVVELEGKKEFLVEIKADKQPVGFRSDKDPLFTHTKLSIKEGEMAFMFSDGFADQFGGPMGKKLGYKNFKKLLLEHHDMPLDELRKFLKTYYNNWIEESEDDEQIDDVCVIGIRF